MGYEHFTISGQSIKVPSSFKIQSFNLTKSGRVASGMMTMDLVAKKRKFILHYDSIDSTDKNKILDLIDSNVMFFPFTYIEDNIEKSATVYDGDLEHALFRTGPAVWTYKDWEIHLIEQ